MSGFFRKVFKKSKTSPNPRTTPTSDGLDSDDTTTPDTDDDSQPTTEDSSQTHIKFLEEEVIDKIPAGFNLRRNGFSLKINDENIVYPDVYVKINEIQYKLDICMCCKTQLKNVSIWYEENSNVSSQRRIATNTRSLDRKINKYFKQSDLDKDVICCMLYNAQNLTENSVNAIANNTVLIIRRTEKLELYLCTFLDKTVVYEIPYSSGLTYYTNLSHKLGENVAKVVDYSIVVKLDTATSNTLLKCPVCNYSNEYYGVGVTTASGNDIVATGSFYDKIKDFIEIGDYATYITLKKDELDRSGLNETDKSIVRKIVEDTNRHLAECKTHFVGNRIGYTNTRNGNENVEFIKYALRYTYGTYDQRNRVYMPFKTFDETLQNCEDVKEFLGLNLNISKDSTTKSLEEKISQEINATNLKRQFIDSISIRDNQNNQYERSFHHICCSHCLYQLPIRLFEKKVQNKYINCTIMLVGSPASGKTVLLTKINYHCTRFIQNQGIDTYYKEKNEHAIFETKTLPQSTNNDNILPTNYITTTLNDTNYTLILKDSVGENARTILMRNYYIVYLIDVTKSATEQFSDLIQTITNLQSVPDSRTYKIYVIFTKSDMVDYDFSNIEYHFNEQTYDFTHASMVRDIFLSKKLKYKPKDDEYYDTCCSHILKKIKQSTGLNILEMNIRNVNIEAIGRNIDENNQTAKRYFQELRNLKDNYETYGKIYNEDYLDELSANIRDFENAVYIRINDNTGKRIIVSYNVTSALEDYTPIWCDSLHDCDSLTRNRFNRNIPRTENSNNIYENLIQDIKEVMVNCDANFSTELFNTPAPQDDTIIV